ncbi:hypothetical protein CGZ94_08170 [Enemella evansiae]|uniref:DUF998 domain-containing protein n=1 Tax=Enemella evansiae TaxID=2016499 RepID=A0A255GG40_9ACTN|nr:DUF998 domain-containing protein [Enemella evansiae]OYO14551.1 hypothetical protein CGZ94_08170 [Enemella evansiae]
MPIPAIPAVAFGGAAALLLGRLGVFAALHRTSDRHPVREAVSDYGVGPSRRLFSVMGGLQAAAWLALALGTWFAFPGWSYRGTAVLMLAALGVLAAVLLLVPTDLEGERLTRRGLLHYLIAVLGFGLSYSLTGDISQMMSTGTGLLVALHRVALISLVLLCVCLVPRLRRWFGLFERIFLVAISLFYLAYAVASILG